MPHVLVIGFDPTAVPGVDATAILAAMDTQFAEFTALGIDTGMALVAPGQPADPIVVPVLTERDWDVVLIGAGIRKPDHELELFEHLVNLVHRHAPNAAIAFNSHPGDTLQAAQRHLPGHQPTH
nr:hypothetical protein [Kibdelosporangium sp. MJ126-NF4]